MMIQTEQHGKIEPRVGDVVLYERSDGTRIELEVGNHLCFLDRVMRFAVAANPERCTLLHRPDAPEYDHSEWEG